MVPQSMGDAPATADSLPVTGLTEASAEAVESTHPGLLSLQRLQGDGPIRHNEDHDWWIVRLQGKVKTGEATTNQSLDVVIVGQAAE